jgi:hypothetical protein
MNERCALLVIARRGLDAVSDVGPQAALNLPLIHRGRSAAISKDAF